MPDSEQHLVLFSLHGELYALPVASVREIIRYVAPSATAAASGLIQGMINLRGRVLPVVDISSRLGRSLEVNSNTRILVIELAVGALGLIVDTVDGVVRLAAEQIEPVPVAVADGFGDQVAAVGDRLIPLINPERALGGVLPAPRRRTSSPARERDKPA